MWVSLFTCDRVNTQTGHHRHQHWCSASRARGANRAAEHSASLGVMAACAHHSHPPAPPADTTHRGMSLLHSCTPIDSITLLALSSDVTTPFLYYYSQYYSQFVGTVIWCHPFMISAHHSHLQTHLLRQQGAQLIVVAVGPLAGDVTRRLMDAGCNVITVNHSSLLSDMTAALLNLLCTGVIMSVPCTH